MSGLRFGDENCSNRRDGCPAWADGEAYLDLRIGPPEGDQVARKPIAGNRLACLNGQRASFQAAEFAQREFGGFGPRQHGPGLFEENVARLRQLDAAPYPIEQFRVVPCFQGRDGVARCGLREIQSAGGLRDVLSLEKR